MTGSTVVEFLLSRQEIIFAPLRVSQSQLMEALKAKCTRVRHLQDVLVTSLDSFPSPPCPPMTALGSGSDHGGTQNDDDTHSPPLTAAQKKKCDEQFQLACMLWVQLGRVERQRALLTNTAPAAFTVESADDENDHESRAEGSRAEVHVQPSVEGSASPPSASSTFSAVLPPADKADSYEQELARAMAMTPFELSASKRWELCGFPSVSPLKDFHSCGLLAAECLLGFLSRCAGVL